jgi:poly(3-hydroxybutyrate) depolymerase
MAATYPDDFAAFGTAAGLEYEITECDTQVSADCGQQLAHNLAFPPTAQATAPDAFHAGQGLAHRMPALVLQGDADTVVPQQNAGAIIDQWIMVNDCVAAPDCPPTQPSGIHVTGTTNLAHGGSTWSVTCYGDPTGPILEKFVVGSMSHEWPHGETTLGNTYPNAAVQMWSFFTTGSSVEGANCH